MLVRIVKSKALKWGMIPTGYGDNTNSYMRHLGSKDLIKHDVEKINNSKLSLL